MECRKTGMESITHIDPSDQLKVHDATLSLCRMDDRRWIW
jgi:hypothetical protein